MVGRECHRGMCFGLNVRCPPQPHAVNTSPANSCVLGGGAQRREEGCWWVRHGLRVSAWSYLLPEFSVCLVGDLWQDPAAMPLPLTLPWPSHSDELDLFFLFKETTIFKSLYIIFQNLCVCAHTYVCSSVCVRHVCSIYEGQKKASGTWKLKLQFAVCPSMWVLGTELNPGSLQKQRVFSIPHYNFFKPWA